MKDTKCLGPELKGGFYSLRDKAQDRGPGQCSGFWGIQEGSHQIRQHPLQPPQWPGLSHFLPLEVRVFSKPGSPNAFSKLGLQQHRNKGTDAWMSRDPSYRAFLL